MKPDKIYLSFALIIIFTTVSWITSCTHKANIEGIPEICFKDVLQIFTSSCAKSGPGYRCHDGLGESRMALNDYPSILRSVVPFNPGSSKAYKAIITTWGENKMPPDRPLSLENRTIIRLWIEQGAGPTTCDTAGTGTGINGYVNPRACFTRDILPVLVSRCATTAAPGSAGCHDVISHKEGYIYTSYAGTMTSVSAGNPGGSKLYQVIKSSAGEDKMPPAGSSQLSAAEIDSIGKWIGYGALDEKCGELCDTINPVTFTTFIEPIIQTSCTGCHSGVSPSGGITLTKYDEVKKIALDGSLINSLRGNGVTRMPQGGSFSPCRIRQFEIWANNGAL